MIMINHIECKINMQQSHGISDINGTIIIREAWAVNDNNRIYMYNKHCDIVYFISPENI